MKNSIKTEINTKKALNYDLDSKKVKKYYKGKNNAWSDVKKFLKENGFYNRQYSGVVSQNIMSPSIAIKYVKLLNKRFPWLKKCIQKFDMTSIENDYDLNYIFKKNEKIK